MGAGVQALGASSEALSNILAGNWIRSRGAGVQASAHMGRQHHKKWLNLLKAVPTWDVGTMGSG